MLTLVFTPGCSRKPEQAEEATGPMASMVRMGDPQARRQLVSGFYGIEQDAWRWTKKDFSVLLRPPAGATQAGASLLARFSVPDVAIARSKSLTLSASINGQALGAPETWEKAGAYAYTRSVPASLLNGDSVKVDFSLDKTMPPAGGDLRELGVIAVSIGLEPK